MTIHAPDPLFDKFYYDHGCGNPYDRTLDWLRLFANHADRIVATINPGSVLDAGCAKGFLVEALRDRGVEAFGIDISHYAIEQVRDDIRPFCAVGTITEPLPRRYDLIVCIEVLEHLYQLDAERAVEVLCRASDDILVTSSPDDFGETTHFNVQPPEYWTALFAQHGFFHDVDYDATYILPWAMRFRRQREPIYRIVEAYERKLWRKTQELAVTRSMLVEQRNRMRELTQHADHEREIAGMYIQAIMATLVNGSNVDVVSSTFGSNQSAGSKHTGAEGQQVDTGGEARWRQLDNLRHCVADALLLAIPGDLLDVDSGDGSACALMLAMLKANGVADRTVWAARVGTSVSFINGERVQESDLTEMRQDGQQDAHLVQKHLVISELFDNQMQVDTKSDLGGDELCSTSFAVVHLGAGVAKSSLNWLAVMYERLAIGGYFAIDLYDPDMAARIREFCDARGIRDEVQSPGGSVAYWRRTS